jgi:hypothetical protein
MSGSAMTRNDIYAHIPEEEMTVAQLTYRRNGRAHGIKQLRAVGHKSDHSVAEGLHGAQAALVKTQALLRRKIGETGIRHVG